MFLKDTQVILTLQPKLRKLSHMKFQMELGKNTKS